MRFDRQTLTELAGHKSNREELSYAIHEADNECDSCACEFDPLYKGALESLA